MSTTIFQEYVQSPININHSSVIPTTYSAFRFMNYNQPYHAAITVTEYSINLQFLYPEYGTLPLVTGGGLINEYVLSSLDFRWSSEHTINGYRYPLEGQLVHYASKYKDFETASNYKDGIAIFSTLYDFSTKYTNNSLNRLISIIPNAEMHIDRPVRLPYPIIPRNFLTPSLGKFYRYQGSLIVPLSNEIATWTVFLKPICFSKTQLENLTKIWNELNKPLTENSRELQNLNGRRVYFSVL